MLCPHDSKSTAQGLENCPSHNKQAPDGDEDKKDRASLYGGTLMLRAAPLHHKRTGISHWALKLGSHLKSKQGMHVAVKTIRKNLRGITNALPMYKAMSPVF